MGGIRMMNFQKFSRAAVVVSALAATAPIFTNLAAADETPSHALTGGDAEVINGTANTGSAAGNSTAGIGFIPGDLVLYQVPNFDFGTNHKFAATLSRGSGLGLMTAASENTRGVVILDNRSSDPSSPVNWALSVKATAFQADSNKLRTSQLKLRPTLTTATQPTSLTETSPYKIDTGTSSLNTVDVKNGDGIGAVVEANEASESSESGTSVAETKTGYTPAGALALSFIDTNSVGFYVGQSDISNITSGSVYKSTLTWTLSTDATNNS